LTAILGGLIQAPQLHQRHFQSLHFEVGVAAMDISRFLAGQFHAEYRLILFRHVRKLADRVPGVVRTQMGVAARNRFAVMPNNHLSQGVACAR